MAQKYYGNGVKLLSGFDPGSNVPLDNRTVVTNYSDLATIPSIQLYEGLCTYVENDDAYYYYDGSTWLLPPAGKLKTPRTINITISGINGTAQSFDGSANIAIPITLATLTRGSYLTGSNFNGGTAATWAVDATSANTVSKVVARDASGNFSANIITATLSGNASTATNISNSGTVTLATATENNAITITQPSYSSDTAVKLLNFNWYSDNWSIGNIRSGSSTSNGLGVYNVTTEKFRFTTTGFKILGNDTYHAGNSNNSTTNWSCLNLTAAGTGTFTGGAFKGSDSRLKSNIELIDNETLSRVDKIISKSFNYISNGLRSYGVIAQELEVEFPELVKYDESGIRSVDYEALHELRLESISRKLDKVMNFLNLK